MPLHKAIARVAAAMQGDGWWVDRRIPIPALRSAARVAASLEFDAGEFDPDAGATSWASADCSAHAETVQCGRFEFSIWQRLVFPQFGLLSDDFLDRIAILRGVTGNERISWCSGTVCFRFWRAIVLSGSYCPIVAVITLIRHSRGRFAPA
jgi:hypothetical protein